MLEQSRSSWRPTMFDMFDQMFNALTRLFKATERAAITIDNLAAVAEERSECFRLEQASANAARRAIADREAQKLIEAA